MILRFAKAAPEEVRAMFRALFDESADVVERITAFKQQAVSLLEQFGDGAAHHYQYENSITTYLWLRYPDKYYIYKYGEVKNVAEFLESPTGSGRASTPKISATVFPCTGRLTKSCKKTRRWLNWCGLTLQGSIIQTQS